MYFPLQLLPQKRFIISHTAGNHVERFYFFCITNSYYPLSIARKQSTSNVEESVPSCITTHHANWIVVLGTSLTFARPLPDASVPLETDFAHWICCTTLEQMTKMVWNDGTLRYPQITPCSAEQDCKQNLFYEALQPHMHACFPSLPFRRQVSLSPRSAQPTVLLKCTFPQTGANYALWTPNPLSWCAGWDNFSLEIPFLS